MRVKYILFGLILPFLLTAQVPADEFKREVRRVSRGLEKGPDVQLPEEELVAVFPNARALATGNWGYRFLEAHLNVEQIKQRAQRKVLVFVLDTGIPTNKYLRPFTRYDLSFSTTSEPDATDRNGHAGHCGGTIAADHPTLELGLATELARIDKLDLVFGKVLTHSGSGDFVDIIEGIDKAVQIVQQTGDLGIISMSLGGSGTNAALEAAVKRAEAAGVLVVCAAGNTGQRGVQIPARYGYAVGAIGEDGKAASFSTFGPEVQACAPGVNTLSTYRDTIALLSGTSMATPHVAAAMAILWSANPNLTVTDLKTIQSIYTDVAPVGRDERTGFGYTTVTKLMSYGGDNPPPPPPPVEPELPKRTIQLFFGPSTANWHYQNGPLRKLHVINMEIEITTKLTDEAAYDLLTSANRDYFKWTLVPRDTDGFTQVAYWVGHFHNLIVGRNNDCRLLSLTAMDEKGRMVVVRDFPKPNSGSINATSQELVAPKRISWIRK